MHTELLAVRCFVGSVVFYLAKDPPLSVCLRTLKLTCIVQVVLHVMLCNSVLHVYTALSAISQPRIDGLISIEHETRIPSISICARFYTARLLAMIEKREKRATYTANLRNNSVYFVHMCIPYKKRPSRVIVERESFCRHRNFNSAHSHSCRGGCENAGRQAEDEIS